MAQGQEKTLYFEIKFSKTSSFPIVKISGKAQNILGAKNRLGSFNPPTFTPVFVNAENINILAQILSMRKISAASFDDIKWVAINIKFHVEPKYFVKLQRFRRSF